MTVISFAFKKPKGNFFDLQYVRKFRPPQFDSFEFLPSIGASGGIISIWKGAKFEGKLLSHNDFAISVEITCKLSSESWILTNIYAPCTTDGKASFLEWFKHIDMSDDIKWLTVGDFNLMRSPENRNKDGGNFNEMLGFNNAISRLRLVEIPLKGCKYTWTNNQPSPLLERLDWFFSSNSWTTAFPSTVASALSRDTSDHTPCLISATTTVPRDQIFRFENY